MREERRGGREQKRAEPRLATFAAAAVRLEARPMPSIFVAPIGPAAQSEAWLNGGRRKRERISFHAWLVVARVEPKTLRYNGWVSRLADESAANAISANQAKKGP